MLILNQSTSNQEITNEMGSRVYAFLKGKICFSSSGLHYDEYYYPNDGRPAFLNSTTASVFLYKNLNHYQLAVDHNVMHDIESSFGW